MVHQTLTNKNVFQSKLLTLQKNMRIVFIYSWLNKMAINYLNTQFSEHNRQQIATTRPTHIHTLHHRFNLRACTRKSSLPINTVNIRRIINAATSSHVTLPEACVADAILYQFMTCSQVTTRLNTLAYPPPFPLPPWHFETVFTIWIPRRSNM